MGTAIASRVPLRRRILRRVVYGVGPRVTGRPWLAKALLVPPRLIPGRRARSSVLRSFSWPLSGFTRTELQVRTTGGLTMTVDTRDVIGRVLAVSGVWEPNVTEVFKAQLSPGDICIDVGAHVGYYSLLASRLVGPAGRVYAFEPAPTAYRALRRNLSGNRASNVTALEVAAGEADGTALLYEGPDTNTGLSSLRPQGRGPTEMVPRLRKEPVSVRIRSVCSVVPPDELLRVRLVKIDVEGYEAEVLHGLEPLLALGAPLALLVELTFPASDRDGREQLELLRAEHGFRLQQVLNEYTTDCYFPSELVDPIDVDEIPISRCDLLLTRP